MKRVTEIPRELAERLPAIRDKWIETGLSTDRVNRAEVETALSEIFATVGKQRPQYVILLSNPLHVGIAIAILRLRAQVSAQVRAQVIDQVRDQVLAQVRTQVSDQVHAQVHDQVHAQVHAQVRAQVSAQVRAQVIDQVHDQVLAQVHAQVRAQVRDQVRDQVRAQVRDQVRDQVRAQVHAQVRDVIQWRWWYGFGQFEAGWVAFYEVMKELGIDTSKLEGLTNFSKVAGWSVMFEQWAFVSDRPRKICRDNLHRLHCNDGPSIEYDGDFSVYAIHGVRVPREVVMAPQSLKPIEIETERNTEIRRVMIERFGQERFLRESGSQEIHRDDYGTLFRKDLSGDEPLVMVKVVNSTPEPDGRFRDYFIRVDPKIRTAREAVAWTFDKTPEEYELAIET